MESIKKELTTIINKLGYSLKEELITPTGGYSSYVFEAKTNKGNFIIRAIKHIGEDKFVLERTVYFMKKMYEKGAISSKVIASGKLRSGRVYFIVEKVEGNSLREEIEKGHLIRKNIINILKSAIRAADKISSIKMKGYGWIIKSKDKFRGIFNTELEDVDQRLKELDFLESNKLLEHQYCQKIRKLLNDNKKLFNLTDPRLVFPDVQFGNIIVKDKKFKGLIDFDWIFSGDPIRNFTALTFFVHNTYEHSTIPDIHTKYKKEIEQATGLNKKETKKLYLHTILDNIGGMRYYVGLGEKIDKRFKEYLTGQSKKINPKAELLVKDYIFHKESNDRLLAIIKN